VAEVTKRGREGYGSTVRDVREGGIRLSADEGEIWIWIWIWIDEEEGGRGEEEDIVYCI
jgi:hypothetical protein